MSVENTSPEFLHPLLDWAQVRIFDRTRAVHITVVGGPALNEQTKRDILDRLPEFDALNVVRLQYTGFSEDQIAELKRRLPECEILVSG